MAPQSKHETGIPDPDETEFWGRNPLLFAIFLGLGLVLLLVAWLLSFYGFQNLEFEMTFAVALPFSLLLFAFSVMAYTEKGFIINSEGVEFRGPAYPYTGDKTKISWEEMETIQTAVDRNLDGKVTGFDIVIKGKDGKNITLYQELIFPEETLATIFQEMARRARLHPSIKIEDDYGWLKKQKEQEPFIS